MNSQASHSPAAIDSRRRDFGRTVLGPIFFAYTHRLRLHLESLRIDQPDGVALFCARGGLRLRLLYDRYCTSLGVESPWPSRNYFISRIAAVRGCLAADFPTARELLVDGMRNVSERQLLATLLRGAGGIATELPATGESMAETPCDVGATLDRIRCGTHPVADAVMTHAREQQVLLETYTRDILGTAPAAALCDSGLRCTVRMVLSKLLPDRDWHGLLLGCLRKGVWAEHYPRLHGLLFDIQLHRDQSRRSTFIRHWELVEHVLEPTLPTTSFYVRCPTNPALAVPDATLAAVAPPIAEGNPFFSGILEYFETIGPDTVASRSGAVHAAYETALTRLDRVLAFPTAVDVATLNVVDHDLGFGLPRLLTSTQRSAASSSIAAKIARVGASGWPHGQARIEFGRLATPLQLVLYRPGVLVRAGEYLGRIATAARRSLARLAAVGRRAIGWPMAANTPVCSAAEVRP